LTTVAVAVGATAAVAVVVVIVVVATVDVRAPTHAPDLELSPSKVNMNCVLAAEATRFSLGSGTALGSCCTSFPLLETTATERRGVDDCGDVARSAPPPPAAAPWFSPMHASFGREDLRAEGTKIWDPDDGDRSRTVFVVRDCREPLACGLPESALPFVAPPGSTAGAGAAGALPLLIAPGAGCPASVGAAAVLLLASTIEGSTDIWVGGRAVAMSAISPMPENDPTRLQLFAALVYAIK
jgi:hypothetical protein